MARPVRLEVPGGIYHVTNRGNDRQTIFVDDADREIFLALVLAEIERCSWILHDYAILSNHFHLLIETPEPNLSKGMQRLEGTYAQWFNRRHGRCGHVLGGRYKSRLVEGGSYLMEVSRYIALNPVRAGIVERPEQYQWSSYRAKAGFEPPPPWLSMVGLTHFSRDLEEGKRAYREFVEARVEHAEEDAESLLGRIVGQLCFGSEGFQQWVQVLLDSEPRSTEHPRYQRDIGRPPLNAIERAVCEQFGITPEEMRKHRGHLSRMVFAMLGYWEGLRTLREIARGLGLRSYAHVSNLVKRCRQECRVDPVLAEIVDGCRTAALAHAPPLPEHYRARLPI